MSFPTTSILDDFNRASVNPLDGNWTNGYWEDNAIQLVDNTQIANQGDTTYSGARYDTSFGPDCEVYISVPTVDTGTYALNLHLRVGGTLAAPDGYYVRFRKGGDENNSQIYRLDDGVETAIGDAFALSLSDGDKLGFSAVGNVLTVYKYTSGAWAQVGQTTDDTYSGAGYLAVEFRGSIYRLDDFGGGDIEGCTVEVIVETNVVTTTNTVVVEE